MRSRWSASPDLKVFNIAGLNSINLKSGWVCVGGVGGPLVQILKYLILQE